MKNILFAALALALGITFGGTSSARAAYPEKPIIVMVPHAAGSSTDLVARAFQPYLQKHLGTPVVIENDGSGGGNGAHLTTFKADPDGYTIELTPFPSMILGEVVKEGNFKALDYTYLYTVTGNDFNGFFVQYDAPYKDMKELLEASKTTSIHMAGSGIGTNGHMALILLEKESGTSFKYISYDGGTQATLGVAGGHAEAGVGNVVALKQMVEEKRIRLLAVAGATRHPSYPDVPSVAELGYPNAAMDVCVGVIAPPKLPDEIKAVLEAALEKAVKDPEFAAQAEKLGSNIVPMGSVEFKTLVERMYKQVVSVKEPLQASSR